MKKNKITFETSFWSAYEAGNPFEALKAFFDFSDLDYYKQILSEVVIYSNRKEICRKDHPGDIFIFYTAFCSFVKIGNDLQRKRKKWKVNATSDYSSVLQLASLTKKEYADPFIVFQKAFEQKTIEEFEFFLSETAHVSLSPYISRF